MKNLIEKNAIIRYKYLENGFVIVANIVAAVKQCLQQ